MKDIRTPKQTYTELRELLNKKYKNIDFNIELKNNSICVKGNTIIGVFVVDLPFNYSSFEERLVYNACKNIWYKCNNYIANIISEINIQLEKLKNRFFFIDGVKFG